MSNLLKKLNPKVKEVKGSELKEVLGGIIAPPAFEVAGGDKGDPSYGNAGGDVSCTCACSCV